MTRNRLLAAAIAAALLFAACSSGDSESSVPMTGQSSGQSAAVTQSVVPDLTPVADLEMADPGEEHVSYAPQVPDPVERTDQRIFEVRLEAIEGVCPLDPENDVSTEMWGYRIDGDTDVQCGTPGPVLRGRVGDLARVTLTNSAESTHPHNIDFHAVTGQGGGAEALTVAPGETATIDARLLYPGAFMYHCAFGDVPLHIAKGMYGMFIVDPATPLPEVEHEWAVMQSEWYVGDANDNGVAPFDPDALFNEEPQYVTFNGRTDALVGDNALKMNVDERARIYMVNEGLNLDSNWHPIGSQWDVVYPEAATHEANDPIRGSQSTLVVTGGGTVTEMVGYVPSTVILVDHALVRTFYKGAIGQVVIEGDENPEIFAEREASEGEAGDSGADAAEEAPTPDSDEETGDAEEGEAVSTNEVTIPEGAFDPSNADNAYDPLEITIPVGTTVTWANEDSVFHTVTSGTVENNQGSPDGTFDSGEIQPGESFSYTFDEAGEFPYYCIPHPWMQGTVVVQ
ncbi:MAG: plastocyanin/azurin family copper-binding protein [Acidimicrobiales bacterium]|nr:plastocyanin/azurin family copper-binding protein [Acidimicrobiales bacterium]